MFGLGFGEILLIAVVALVVLGPERLPHVARSAGLWVGRIQGFINNVKVELSQQVGVAEFKQARDGIEAAVRSFEQDVNSNMRGIQTEMNTLKQRLGSDGHQYEIADSQVQSDLPEYDYAPTEPPLMHRVSLRRQALQRKRDFRPRGQIVPKLRVRRQYRCN